MTYTVLYADGRAIVEGVSWQHALSTARRVLGVRRLTGVGEALQALNAPHPHSGWVHESRRIGCASVEIVLQTRG